MSLDLRLSIPVAAAWLVAVVLIGIPTAAVVVAVALWLAAAATIGVALVTGRQLLAGVALACALAAACSTSVAIQGDDRQPAALAELAAAHSTVEVVGTTTSAVTAKAAFFEAQLSEVRCDDTVLRLNSPALVFRDNARFAPANTAGPANTVGLANTAGLANTTALANAVAPWGVGVSFTVSGTLTVTDAGDGRAVLVFASQEPRWLADPDGVIAWANQLRATFATAARALPGGGGELIGGLAIGDTAAVSDELDAAMKSSALSHLTAVSGANCALIVGLIMMLGARLGAPRMLRIALSAVVLVAFVVLVTPDPSVLRAALMAFFVLIALGMGRPIRGMAVLSLAAISLLIGDPWLARNFGFVLSVFATAGLLLFAQPLALLLGRWLPRWLSLVVAVPLAAQLACQPVLVLLQPTLPTYGVVANVLAAPAAPVATVLGLAACLALSVLPPLGAGLLWIAWFPSAWVAAVALFFAGAPGAQIPWWEGWVGALALAVFTVLLLAALMMRNRWRQRALVVLLVGVTLVGAAAAGRGVNETLSWPADWQFAQCDVGQGDAVVVRNGSSIALVDTGPLPDRLTACLDRLGIDHIDLLVLTHFDLDHIGGAEAVLGRASTVLVGPTGSAHDADLVDAFAAAGAKVVSARTGDHGELGELDWSVLWPGQRLAGIGPGNDASVTVQFLPTAECLRQCLRSVFLADLGESAQSRLFDEHQFSTVDVVKVSHHGSADQFPPLYAALNAAVGLVGVGADNGYGHPTATALTMLDAAGTVAARSDLAGLVLLSSEPRSGPGSGAVSLWSQRPTDGRR